MKIRTINLLSIVGFLTSDLCSLTSAAALNADMISLINRTALVKYAHVATEASGTVFNGKALTGSTYYEASIQSNTFWVANTTNSTAWSGVVLPGCIAGASSTDYWTLENNHVALSPISETLSPVSHTATAALAAIRDVLGLGIRAKAGTFVLLTNDRFSAESALDGWLTGVFLDYDTLRRPARADYLTTGSFPHRSIVDYVYEGQRTIPSSYTLKIVDRKGKTRTQHRFDIIECDIGPLTSDLCALTSSPCPLASGFVPAQFTSNAQHFSSTNSATILFSNSIAYAQTATGLVALDSPDLFKEPPKDRYNLWLILFASVLILLPISLYVLARSLQKRRSNLLSTL